MGTSCSSLKQSGYFKSGYYNIKEDNSKKVVFCDMTSDSYEDVPQSDEIVLSTIEDNKREIEELSLHGQWCAYQNGWSSETAVISYDSSFFEDSNINNNALNVGTGETLIKYEASNNNNNSRSIS